MLDLWVWNAFTADVALATPSQCFHRYALCERLGVNTALAEILYCEAKPNTNGLVPLRQSELFAVPTPRVRMGEHGDPAVSRLHGPAWPGGVRSSAFLRNVEPDAATPAKRLRKLLISFV